jgi:hypothetical protein
LGSLVGGKRVSKRVSSGYSLWVFMEFILLFVRFIQALCVCICPLFLNKWIFKLPFLK